LKQAKVLHDWSCHMHIWSDFFFKLQLTANFPRRSCVELWLYKNK
jgi:hypothetical protein